MERHVNVSIVSIFSFTKYDIIYSFAIVIPLFTKIYGFAVCTSVDCHTQRNNAFVCIHSYALYW